ncbi:hypothetical protein ZTR_00381 [Talaromyces verruculosus]|nr:hypothetical protein ZTR_00381 [Talaromyces verruculosus]
MIPVTVLHPPLMSTKLLNATAWDDINGPNPEISALTLFQRDIAENMVLDSIAEATGPNADSANSDVTLISLLSLLSFEIVNGDEVGYLRHKRNIHRLIDMRGGVDTLDVNLKICLLVIYQHEPVIKGFADSVSPSLDFITENETLIMSQPTDFKLMTFERGQAQFWDGNIGLSTYQQLSNSHPTQNEDMQRRLQIRIQWNFLRDNLIALNSIPVHIETDQPIDQILLYAISLFVSPSFAVDQAAIEEYITKLQSLLQKSNVLHLYHGPLPGALIWCLIIGARKSDETSSRQPGDPLNPISSTRKWFFMQLIRITCPAALDDPVDVSRNIDMILAGMDGVDCLARESYRSGMITG